MTLVVVLVAVFRSNLSVVVLVAANSGVSAGFWGLQLSVVVVVVARSYL